MADRSEDRPLRGWDADGFDYFGGFCGLGRLPGDSENFGRGERVVDESGYRDFRGGVVCCGRGEYVDGRDQGGVFGSGGAADFSGDFLAASDRGCNREVEVSLNREGRDGDG